MGLTHWFDRDHDIMYATARGPTTLEDIRAHLEHERAQHGLTCKELIDARAASPAVSSEDVRSLVTLLREWSRQYRLGPTAVVLSTDVAFGMVRMLDMLVDEFCEIHPFRDMNEAEAWLSADRQGNT